MSMNVSRTHSASSKVRLGLALVLLAVPGLLLTAKPNGRRSTTQSATPYTEPRWMAKMRALQSAASTQSSSGINVGANVDVSNEPGPQS